MRISNIYLKQSFSYFKWVLQAILSLTFLSNCVPGILYFDTTFLPDYLIFQIYIYYRYQFKSIQSLIK